MKTAVLSILLSLLTFAARGAEVSQATEAERLKAAADVFSIFEAKCVDCHGAQLPRPKAKFGFVLDLKRVSSVPDYVVKGNPEKSELYRMVQEDEMPGDDAKVGPLTKAEKEAVRHWVSIGAPGELPPNLLARAKPANAAPVVLQIGLPVWKRLLRWIGRFHPVSTHFPVALINVAVLAELLAWASRREAWLQTVRFLMVVAALSAVSAASLGWVNAYFTSYVGQSAAILLWHRWLGTGAALWASVCAVLVFAGACKEGSPERTRFRGALLVGALLVGVVGFLGSALIYGLDHYSWK